MFDTWLVSSVSISLISIWFLFHLCTTNSGFVHTESLNRTPLGVLIFTDVAFIMLGRKCNQLYFITDGIFGLTALVFMFVLCNHVRITTLCSYLYFILCLKVKYYALCNA